MAFVCRVEGYYYNYFPKFLESTLYEAKTKNCKVALKYILVNSSAFIIQSTLGKSDYG